MDEPSWHVQRSPLGGRGVFATRHIRAGSPILSSERPFVAALDASRLRETCANCYVSNHALPGRPYAADKEYLTLKLCNGCRVMRYCGKECQKEHWDAYHRIECRLINKRPRYTQLPSSLRATIQTFMTLQKRTAEDREGFSALLSHLDDRRISKNTQCWDDIQFLSNGILRLIGQTNNSDCSVAEVLCKILTNSLTLISPSYDPLGICLDVSASLVNHSCEPNAYVVMNGLELTLQSFRNIEKGEEILISYIDCTEPAWKRRIDLENNHFFECLCNKCRRECRVLLPRMRALEEEGFKILQATRKIASDRPKEKVSLLREGITIMKSSKIFKYSNQPMAMMRHDLFLELIASHDYADALWHALVLYYEVNTELYCVPFHPVRVVQNFVFGKYVDWFCSMNVKPPTPDLQRINLLMLAHGFLAEAEKFVELSHGLHNSFTARVKFDVQSSRVDLRKKTLLTFSELAERAHQEIETVRTIVRNRLEESEP